MGPLIVVLMCDKVPELVTLTVAAVRGQCGWSWRAVPHEA